MLDTIVHMLDDNGDFCDVLEEGSFMDMRED